MPDGSGLLVNDVTLSLAKLNPTGLLLVEQLPCLEADIPGWYHDVRSQMSGVSLRDLCRYLLSLAEAGWVNAGGDAEPQLLAGLDGPASVLEGQAGPAEESDMEAGWEPGVPVERELSGTERDMGQRRLWFLVVWRLQIEKLSMPMVHAVMRMPEYGRMLESSGSLLLRTHVVGEHGGAWVYTVRSNEELEMLLARSPVYNMSTYTIHPLASFCGAVVTGSYAG